MNEEPFRYGWFNGDQIACFYHEDPFGDNNAIFDFIDKTGINGSDEFVSNLRLIKNSILKKYKSLAEFSQDCFYLSTSKFKEEGKLMPVDDALSVAEKIDSLNTDIVVVSNSKTVKIEYVFEKAGIGINENQKVRVRGDAGKFLIDNSFDELPEFLEIDKQFRVPLRRKGYYKILSEEIPDFVIGDVFSLDIALPLYLRMNDNRFSDLKVIQRVQPYTPGWVKNFLSGNEFKGIAFLAETVTEAPAIIANNS